MRLIESSQKRRRRPTGVVVSVVLHATAIGLAVAATARAAERLDAPVTADIAIYVAPPPEPAPAPTAGRPGASSASPAAPTAPPAPAFEARALPAIDVPAIGLPPAVDPAAAAAASFATDRTLGSGIPGGDPSGGGVLDANAVDRAVVALPGAAPRYPEALRAAGVSGRVVVRFVVDTLGRVEPAGVAITAATHPLFADAVRRTLPSLRFRPAEARGQRVRQLVEMPFEFVVR